MRRVPWIALATVAAAALIQASVLLGPYAGLMPACAFKRITGIPCATCGLTRCLLALAQGRWAEALHWYPALALVGVLLLLGSPWDLRRAWRGDPYPALPDSPAVRLGIWALLAGVWILQAVRGI